MKFWSSLLVIVVGSIALGWPGLSVDASPAPNTTTETKCEGENCKDPNVKGFSGAKPQKYSSNNPANLAMNPDAGGDPITNAQNDEARMRMIQSTDAFGQNQGPTDEEISEGNHAMMRSVAGDGTDGSSNSDGSSNASSSSESSSSSNSASSSSSESGGGQTTTSTTPKKLLNNTLCWKKDAPKGIVRGYKVFTDGPVTWVLGNPTGRGWGYTYNRNTGEAYVGQFNNYHPSGRGYKFIKKDGKGTAKLVDYDNLGYLVTSMESPYTAYWNEANPTEYLRTLMEHLIRGHVLETHRPR